MITVLELLQTAAKYLEKHGVENPRLNVEHLLAQQLGLKRMELYMQFDRPLDEKVLQPLREKVKQRAQRIPLQHLLGTVEFHGQVFRSDTRALIPRPETEHFVELIIDRTKNAPKTRILDVGTGSGVIATTLALKFPEASVTAVDISESALELARINAESLKANRVRFLLSDLFEAIPAEEKFDLIAANLPYVTTREMTEISPEVRLDPALALDGGADGLDIIRRLVREAPQRLLAEGILALEIGHGQGYALTELLQECCFDNVAVLKDYQRLERFVFAKYG